MSGVEAMIREAESDLGIVGTPNRITRAYAARNGSYYATAPWCNQSITEWARRSGNFQPVMFAIDEAYTVYHAQRFAARGRWHVDVAGIRRGDVLFFDWGGTNSIGNIDHVGLVTGVNGRDVYTIEGNTSNSCRRRVRNYTSIVGYGRPAYASATPAPAPSTPSAPVPAGMPPFPAGLRPGSSRPSAKQLQRMLKAAGYMAQSVTLDDNYGPKTQAGVVKFHTANPTYADRPGDPAIGPLGWAELYREARD